ncbi:hypothetical protein D3C86_1242500 [compost metagenome]
MTMARRMTRPTVQIKDLAARSTHDAIAVAARMANLAAAPTMAVTVHLPAAAVS